MSFKIGSTPFLQLFLFVNFSTFYFFAANISVENNAFEL